jgi:hypothetical protein
MALTSPIAQALQQVGNQIVKQMQANLQRNGSNAGGTLSKSIESTVVEGQVGPKLQISMLPYGADVNEGRRPSKSKSGTGFAPKIGQWIREKGITPRNGISKEQLEFLIYRKINKKGYKAKPFIQPAVNTVINQDLTGIFGAAVAKEIEIIFNKK